VALDRRVLAPSPGIIGSFIRYLDIIWQTRRTYRRLLAGTREGNHAESDDLRGLSISMPSVWKRQYRDICTNT
jgi:hypothetical protein